MVWPDTVTDLTPAVGGPVLHKVCVCGWVRGCVGGCVGAWVRVGGCVWVWEWVCVRARVRASVHA